MAGSEEQIIERVHQFVAGAAEAPWRFSADDARQAARRRPLLIAVAHRTLTTMVATAAVVSIVAVLLVAGVFSAGPSISPAGARPDGVVEGFLRAVGGPAPSCRPGHESHCYPGYEELSGTVRLVPASAGGKMYSTNAVDGRWKIKVPPGSYRASGRSPQMGGGTFWTFPGKPIIVQSGQTLRNVYVAFQIS